MTDSVIQALESRLAEIMPLFTEARDALTAISMASAKLHRVDLTLGTRMDAVGEKDWRSATPQPVQPARWIDRPNAKELT